jgi:hypothetical protein
MQGIWVVFEFVGSLLRTEEFRGFMLLAGAGIAVASIHTSRVLARKKQTADLLFASRTDERLQKGIAEISKLATAADRNIASLANIDYSDDQTTADVRYVLNHFESVCVGVHAGIYHEQMLKDAWYSVITLTYDRSLPLTSALQQKNSTMLQDFCCLARRWKKKPLRSKKGRD